MVERIEEAGGNTDVKRTVEAVRKFQDGSGKTSECVSALQDKDGIPHIKRPEIVR